MTTRQEDLSQGFVRRAVADFGSQSRAAYRTALALSAVFGLVSVVIFGWLEDGFSVTLLYWAAIATLGALVLLEVIVFSWLVMAAPSRQRDEARHEAGRLQEVEREAWEQEEELHRVRRQLDEANKECDRLRPFEARAINRLQDLKSNEAELSRTQTELRSAQQQIEELRSTVRRLEIENCFLEEAQLEEMLDSAASEQGGSAGSALRHALGRYQREAREAASQAAVRVSEDVISFVPYPPPSAGRTRNRESMMALVVGPRKGGDRKVILVEALLPFGGDVAQLARQLAGRLRPRDVHGSLILIDELHERRTRQIRSELEGLPRVEVVACQRRGQPHDGRVEDALSRLLALPPRSDEVHAEVDRWLKANHADR